MTIPETIEGLPNLSGWDAELRESTARRGPVTSGRSPFRANEVASAFGIALHMHQPLIIDEGDLRTARIVGNLEFMMQRAHVHGFHDAPAYLSC